MLFHVAICDDDPGEHCRLKELFCHLGRSTPYSFCLRHFYRGEELLEHYRSHGRFPFHFILMDIEMEGISGIETAARIRLVPDREVQIVFVTSYPKYMLDSFNVQAFQYLVKPFSPERAGRQITQLCHYIHTSVERFVAVKTEEDELVLRQSDIVAVLKIKHALMKNKLEFITVQRQRHLVTGTLSEYAARLPYPFLMVQRSTIVNLEHIRKFSSGAVVMSDGEEYPVGRAYAHEVKDAYSRYLFAHLEERSVTLV